MKFVGGRGYWQLLYLSGASKPPWKNLKLISEDVRMCKRNYWPSWNVEERRLARNHDAGVLAQRHPQVYEWLVKTLERVF